MSEPAECEGRIAFSGRVINVQDGVAGTLTRLTDSPEDKGFPVWSPDGACLAFQQYRGNVLELYVVSAGGTGLRRLAEKRDLGQRYELDTIAGCCMGSLTKGDSI